MLNLVKVGGVKMTVRVLTTSYPIFSGEKIAVGIFGGTAEKNKSINVTWKPDETTVSGARLVFEVTTDQVLIASGSDSSISFNGNEVFHRTLWGTDIVNESVDVTSLLQNGVNSIVASAYAYLHGVTHTVTISLEVDFVGVTPKIEPALLGMPVTTLLLIGGGIIFAVILGVIISVGGRKKRQ